MSAYIFAEIDVFDKEQYKAYQEKTPETIKKFGGRFIVRGGNPEILEGQLDSKRMVVIEFQDKKAAQKWYYSEEYQSILTIRQSASKGRMFLLEGV